LTITITVPLQVFEWYVDAKGDGTGLEAHDWYDYAGYESDGNEDLDHAMAEDLTRFLENVLTRPLRMREPGSRLRAALDWQTDGSWKQCVPLKAE